MNYDLLPVIRELGLEHRVHLTGFVDSALFEAYLRAIDIGVNLRTSPSGGEMSASVVRLLPAGRPTIVSDIDGFAELPSDCVIKIKQDEYEVDRWQRRSGSWSMMRLLEHAMAQRRSATRNTNWPSRQSQDSMPLSFKSVWPE